MLKALLLGTLMVAAGAAVALPVNVSTGIVGFGEGPLSAQIIVKHLGYVPKTADITTYGLDGPVKRTVAWEELVAALDQTSSSGKGWEPDGPVASSRCKAGNFGGVWCGPDAGSGHPDNAPFCDDSSAWVIYSGAPAGSSYTEMTPGSGPAPLICGGFFGPTTYWSALEMSAAKVPDVAAGLVYEGCFSSVWTIHSNQYCPNPFPISGGGAPTQGAFDSWILHWRFKGPGVAATLGFGGTEFDYLLGGIGWAQDTSGSTCYDLPPGITFGAYDCA